MENSEWTSEWFFMPHRNYDNCVQINKTKKPLPCFIAITSRMYAVKNGVPFAQPIITSYTVPKENNFRSEPVSKKVHRFLLNTRFTYGI